MIAEPTTFETLDGRCVAATVDGKSVLVGNQRLLTDNDIAFPEHDPTATVAWVALDGAVVGAIAVADQILPDDRDAIAQLRATGIRRIAMLTGDNAAAADHIATQLGIDEVVADLLPDHKVDAVRALKPCGDRVALVGDGVNDAPALAAADVGIAMGVDGARAALEAVDIALLTDDLTKIVFAPAIARRAYRTIEENLFVSVGVVHVLAITAALIGLIGPVQAAIIHLGPDVPVFLNSTKLLRVHTGTGHHDRNRAPTVGTSRPRGKGGVSHTGEWCSSSLRRERYSSMVISPTARRSSSWPIGDRDCPRVVRTQGRTSNAIAAHITSIIGIISHIHPQPPFQFIIVSLQFEFVCLHWTPVPDRPPQPKVTSWLTSPIQHANRVARRRTVCGAVQGGDRVAVRHSVNGQSERELLPPMSTRSSPSTAVRTSVPFIDEGSRTKRHGQVGHSPVATESWRCTLSSLHDVARRCRYWTGGRVPR